MSLNTGVLTSQMGHIIGRDRAMAIATQSDSIKGIQRLMKGDLGGSRHADTRRGRGPRRLEKHPPPRTRVRRALSRRDR